jgi:hypothetical protein
MSNRYPTIARTYHIDPQASEPLLEHTIVDPDVVQSEAAWTTCGFGPGLSWRRFLAYKHNRLGHIQEAEASKPASRRFQPGTPGAEDAASRLCSQTPQVSTAKMPLRAAN